MPPVRRQGGPAVKAGKRCGCGVGDNVSNWGTVGFTTAGVMEDAEQGGLSTPCSVGYSQKTYFLKMLPEGGSSAARRSPL